MTTHRRHGLELREGRWCSRQDLERLRREAAEGGLEDVERFLREDQRCGTPLYNNLVMVRRYAELLARKIFPEGAVVSPFHHKGIYGHTLIPHPPMESAPRYSVEMTKAPNKDLTGRFAYWQFPQGVVPSAALLVRTREILDVPYKTLNQAAPETIVDLRRFLNTQLKLMLRLSSSELKRRERRHR